MNFNLSYVNFDRTKGQTVIAARSAEEALSRAWDFITENALRSATLYYAGWKIGNDKGIFREITTSDIIQRDIEFWISIGSPEMAIELYEDRHFDELVKRGLKQWQPEPEDNPNATALTEYYFTKYGIS